MTSLITPSPQDPKERLLILFPEDLLFLSVDEERTTVTYEVTGNSRDGQTGTELRSGEQLWVMKINSREEKKKEKPPRKAVFSFSFSKGKLPLAGIQAKEKSTVLGRLQLEITGTFKKGESSRQRFPPNTRRHIFTWRVRQQRLLRETVLNLGGSHDLPGYGPGCPC